MALNNRTQITSSEAMLKGIKERLQEINNYSVKIGIFGEDDSFYAMIANVHEYGMTITPKNGKYLTIPISPVSHGKRASDFPDLFRPKGTNILAIPADRGNFEPLFALVTEVTIPERSFVRSTFDEQEEEWYTFLKGRIRQVVLGRLSAKDMYEQMGAIAAGAIQQKMVELRTPENAGATTAAKRSSSPLIDTGGLRQRVTWKVVPRNA